MFKISLDPGYCYDVLAIDQIKMEKGVSSRVLFDLHSGELRQQVGVGGHKVILESPEFLACLAANRLTFDGVEDAWKDKVLASYVCRMNDQRYIAKLALQKRFFPNTGVTENKSITNAK